MLSDFSLTEWMTSEHVVPSLDVLPSYLSELLLDELGISQHIDDTCNSSSALKSWNTGK